MAQQSLRDNKRVVRDLIEDERDEGDLGAQNHDAREPQLRSPDPSRLVRQCNTQRPGPLRAGHRLRAYRDKRDRGPCGPRSGIATRRLADYS